MSNLKEVFPDINQSILIDVVHQCQGNEEKAKELLKEFQEQAQIDKQRTNNKKIEELSSTFPLDRAIIETVLSQNNWNPEQCLLPLFMIVEQQKETEQKKKDEESRRRREDDNRKKKRPRPEKKANDFLKQLFNTVSEDQIQHILEENEGDVDATTDQLVRLVTKKEEEERKVQQLRKIQQEREMIIEILVNRFSNLKKDQIISTVEKHLWNVKTASIELLKQSEKKKKGTNCSTL